MSTHNPFELNPETESSNLMDETETLTNPATAAATASSATPAPVAHAMPLGSSESLNHLFRPILSPSLLAQMDDDLQTTLNQSADGQNEGLNTQPESGPEATDSKERHEQNLKLTAEGSAASGATSTSASASAEVHVSPLPLEVLASLILSAIDQKDLAKLKLWHQNKQNLSLIVNVAKTQSAENNPTTQNPEPHSALSYAIVKVSEEEALIDFLLEISDEHSKQLALYYAVLKKKLSILQKILKKTQENYVWNFPPLVSPLELAITSIKIMTEAEDRAAIKALVEARRFIHYQNPNTGHTSLMHAIHSNIDLTETVEGLLKLGAQPEIQDKNGNTAFHHAVLNWKDELSLEALLDSDSFDVPMLAQQNKKKMTTLATAFQQGHVQAVNLIFTRLIDRDGGTELVDLCESDLKNIFHYFLKANGDNDDDGLTILKNRPASEILIHFKGLKTALENLLAWGTHIDNVDETRPDKNLIVQFKKFEENTHICQHVDLDDSPDLAEARNNLKETVSYYLDIRSLFSILEKPLAELPQVIKSLSSSGNLRASSTRDLRTLLKHLMVDLPMHHTITARRSKDGKTLLHLAVEVGHPLFFLSNIVNRNIYFPNTFIDDNNNKNITDIMSGLEKELYDTYDEDIHHLNTLRQSILNGIHNLKVMLEDQNSPASSITADKPLSGQPPSQGTELANSSSNQNPTDPNKPNKEDMEKEIQVRLAKMKKSVEDIFALIAKLPELEKKYLGLIPVDQNDKKDEKDEKETNEIHEIYAGLLKDQIQYIRDDLCNRLQDIFYADDAEDLQPWHDSEIAYRALSQISPQFKGYAKVQQRLMLLMTAIPDSTLTKIYKKQSLDETEHQTNLTDFRNKTALKAYFNSLAVIDSNETNDTNQSKTQAKGSKNEKNEKSNKDKNETSLSTSSSRTAAQPQYNAQVKLKKFLAPKLAVSYVSSNAIGLKIPVDGFTTFSETMMAILDANKYAFSANIDDYEALKKENDKLRKENAQLTKSNSLSIEVLAQPASSSSASASNSNENAKLHFQFQPTHRKNNAKIRKPKRKNESTDDSNPNPSPSSSSISASSLSSLTTATTTPNPSIATTSNTPIAQPPTKKLKK